LKEEESGNRFITVIVDNFSKLVGLYPAQNTTSKEFVRALIQVLRTRSAQMEFTSQLSSDVCSLLGYHHLVVVKPQTNGLVERGNIELLKHLR
jgi:hypothetical protein